MMSGSGSVDKSKVLQVLKAATKIFLTYGFSASTTDMIQREAHVSKATMYACFPNKESMFAAVIQRECAVMAKAIESIQVGHGGIAVMLKAIGMAYLEIVLSPSGLALYRVSIAEAPRFPELGRVFYLAGPKVMISVTARRLYEASNSGELDIHVLGVEPAASLFVSMVRGEGQMEALTHPESLPSAVQIEQWVDRAVNTFIAAFCS